jgi:hypothetical protein
VSRHLLRVLEALGRSDITGRKMEDISFRECAETQRVNGRCPQCVVAVSTGTWDAVNRSAEVTFSHIRELNYLSINITLEES